MCLSRPLGLTFFHVTLPVDEMLCVQPGIWEAVEGDDAMNVRKLINEWCRVDVQKVSRNGSYVRASTCVCVCLHHVCVCCVVCCVLCCILLGVCVSE